MQKIDPNISLIRYKFNEYMAIYDGYSESERILCYRLGWHLFLTKNRSFEQYANFLRKRNRVKYLFLDWPFYLIVSGVVFISILNLFILKAIVWSDFNWGMWLIITLLIIKYGMFHSIKNNLIQTEEFLSFISNKNKKSNFNFFQSIKFDDIQKAEILYKRLLVNDDFTDGHDHPTISEVVEDSEAKEIQQESAEEAIDKTIKLLLLDFLLGDAGIVNDLINKLVADSDQKLTKKGIYFVLGKILQRTPGNIRPMIEGGLFQIRNEKPSGERIEQLLEIKKIFINANLGIVADEVEKVIRKINNDNKT